MKTKFLCLLLCLVLQGVQGQSAHTEKTAQPDLKDTLKAKELVNRSLVFLMDGQFDSSFHYADRSFLISKKLRHKPGCVRSLINLGHIHNYKGEYKQALHLYSLALNLLGNPEDPLANRIFNGMASAYYSLDNFPEALNYYYKALKLAEQSRDTSGMYAAYSNLGPVFLAQGNTTSALEYSEKALSFYRAKKDTQDMKIILDRIGQVYVQEGKRDKAISYFEEELKLAKARRDEIGEIGAYIGMYALLPEPSRIDSALYQLNRVLGIAYKINDRTQTITCLYIIGKLYLAQKNYAKAIDYLLRSRNMAVENEMITEISMADEYLTKAYEGRGDFKNALAYYSNSITIRDSLLSTDNTKKSMQAELNYQFEKKQLALKQEQEKKDAVAKEARKKQELIIWTISGLSLLLLVIAFLVVRQVRYKNRQREMQLEQKLLRSQMNPHFIFNSLQAIQNFVLKNDQKDAVKYLGSFASITRSVLENSRLESIPLRKEITLLENYLQLQKLRFDNAFEYTISVDEDIDIDDTFIPPMLAQPFIENALEHGLSSLSQGLIQVSFRQSGDQLLMEISDNGNGIVQHREIVKTHTSLATLITRERIALMNKKKHSKVAFSMSEAYPGAERKGLKVRFSISMPA